MNLSHVTEKLTALTATHAGGLCVGLMECRVVWTALYVPADWQSTEGQ